MIGMVAADVMAPLQHLLAAINDAATDLGMDLPARQYITTGGAVHDCPQVTVSANALTSGAADSPQFGAALAACDVMWNVELEMVIVRAAQEMNTGPRGTVPAKPERIESDAIASMTDASCLVRAVMSIVGPNDYGSVPTSVTFGEVAGGLTAVVVGATVNLWALQAA